MLRDKNMIKKLKYESYRLVNGGRYSCICGRFRSNIREIAENIAGTQECTKLCCEQKRMDYWAILDANGVAKEQKTCNNQAAGVVGAISGAGLGFALGGPVGAGIGGLLGGTAGSNSDSCTIQ